jgi:hydrogenase maturation protease
VLGIGNVLMGDEGVGVCVVRHLEAMEMPGDVVCVDGGTGSFNLLGDLQAAESVIIVDAANDGRPPGSVCRLRPRFSRDYPKTLTAHDIGLKDLLDAFHLMGRVPDVTLYTVSIVPPEDVGTDLTGPIAAVVPDVAQRILDDLRNGHGQA